MLAEKNLMVDLTRVRERAHEDSIKFGWVATEHMLADGLTKNLKNPKALNRCILQNKVVIRGRYDFMDKELGFMVDVEYDAPGRPGSDEEQVVSESGTGHQRGSAFVQGSGGRGSPYGVTGKNSPVTGKNSPALVSTGCYEARTGAMPRGGLYADTSEHDGKRCGQAALQDEDIIKSDGIGLDWSLDDVIKNDGTRDGRDARGEYSGVWYPGDWTCPDCGDHQFARNTTCRQCPHSRPRRYRSRRPFLWLRRNGGPTR